MPFVYVAAGAAIVGGVAEYGAAQQSAEAAEKAEYKAMLHARINLIRQEREAYQVIGAQEAATGAAGFSLSGSAIDLLKSSISNASLDAALIASGGQLEAEGYAAQAGAARAQGYAGLAGGIAGAAGTLGRAYA